MVREIFVEEKASDGGTSKGVKPKVEEGTRKNLGWSKQDPCLELTLVNSESMPKFTNHVTF